MGSVCRTWVSGATMLAALSLFSPGAQAASVTPQLKMAQQRGAAARSVKVDIYVYSPVPLGAYTLQLSFDPAQLELAAIAGGRTREFGGEPVANQTAFASGNVRFSAFQAASLESPSGRVHVATLTFHTKDRATGAGARHARLQVAAVAIEAITLADTQGQTYQPGQRSARLRYRVQ